MNGVLSAPGRRAALGGRAARRWLVVAVVVAAAVGATIAIHAWSSGPAATGATPTNPAIEATWGIRVTHVAVTADGGLVELRFVVLDSDRALAMMQNVANIPVLRNEVTGALAPSVALMAAKHQISAGRESFLLYRNTRGAVKPNQPVSIVFGTLELDHVVAQ